MAVVLLLLGCGLLLGRGLLRRLLGCGFLGSGLLGRGGLLGGSRLLGGLGLLWLCSGLLLGALGLLGLGLLGLLLLGLGGELVRSLDLGEDTLLGHVLQGLVDEAVELDNVHLVVSGNVLLDGGEGAAVPLLEGLDGGLDHRGHRRVGRRGLGLGGLLGRGLGVDHVDGVGWR